MSQKRKLSSAPSTPQLRQCKKKNKMAAQNNQFKQNSQDLVRNLHEDFDLEDRENIDELNALIEQVKGICHEQAKKAGPQKALYDTVAQVMQIMIPALAVSVEKTVERVLSRSTEKTTCESNHNLTLFRCDRVEQRLLRDNLRVVGVPESDEEESVEVLRQKVVALASQIDVQLEGKDIVEVYRIGKKQTMETNGRQARARDDGKEKNEEQSNEDANSQSQSPKQSSRPRPRPIHVQLRSHELKAKIWEKKRNLKSLENKVFLNEELTPARALMLKKIRENCKEYITTTTDGKILAFKKPEKGKKDTQKKTKPITVETPDDLFALGFEEEDYNEVVDTLKRQ